MSADGKKKIKVKEFLKDVEAGMHATPLMAKHGLSPGELQKVFEKLEEKGLLKVPRPAISTSAPTAPLQTPFECLSCGAVHAEPFDECPNCGIVLSKFRSQVEDSERYPTTGEQRESPSDDYSPMPVLEFKHFFRILGMVVLAAVLIGAYLAYRWTKASQNLALARNVQAVLDAGNGPTKPNYARLAQMFGSATGAMGAVMESRKTRLDEKMHELYQKLFYLGELQTRMRVRTSGTTTNPGAYRRSIEEAGQTKRVIDAEFDSLKQGLTEDRRALAEAGEPESPTESPDVPLESPAEAEGAGARRSNDERDSTRAQFARAEEELRSLCAEVLQMLAVR